MNKQRAQYGETKAEKKKDREGNSPDRNLPISNYQHLTVAEVKSRLDDLPRSDLKKVRSYEQKHKGRKTLLSQMDRRLEAR